MRRLAVRLSYIAVPLIAICAFLFVQQQMDGLAPAPPAAIPGPVEVDSTRQTQPTQPRPTVLAPDDETLPSAAVGMQHSWPSSVVAQSSFSERSDFTPPFDPSDLEVDRSATMESPKKGNHAPFSTARESDRGRPGGELEIR